MSMSMSMSNIYQKRKRKEKKLEECIQPEARWMKKKGVRNPIKESHVNTTTSPTHSVFDFPKLHFFTLNR